MTTLGTPGTTQNVRCMKMYEYDLDAVCISERIEESKGSLKGTLWKTTIWGNFNSWGNEVLPLRIVMANEQTRSPHTTGQRKQEL